MLFIFTPWFSSIYREIFDLIDLDGGGSLDAEEMMKLMDMLGMLAMEEEVIELIEQIDSTGDGEVYFEDFVEATNKKVEVDYKAKDVIKAFDFFSKSFHRPKGTLNAKDIEQILTSFGSNKFDEDLTEKIIGDLPKRAGKDKVFEYRPYVQSAMNTS